MFAKKDYVYVRKLGGDAKNTRTSVNNVPFKGSGSPPTYLQVRRAGEPNSHFLPYKELNFYRVSLRIL